jgi:hypothetical protein
MFPKEYVVLSIIQASCPLYEIAIGSTTGRTPMKVGVAIRRFADCSEVDVAECKEPADNMAKDFLEWVYADGPKPEWVRE